MRPTQQSQAQLAPPTHPPPFKAQALRPILPARLPSVSSAGSSVTMSGGSGPTNEPTGFVHPTPSAPFVRQVALGPWQLQQRREHQAAGRPAWSPPPQQQQQPRIQQHQQQQQQQHQQHQTQGVGQHPPAERPLVSSTVSAPPPPSPLQPPATPTSSAGGQKPAPFAAAGQLPRAMQIPARLLPAGVAGASIAVPSPQPQQHQQMMIVRRAPQPTALAVQYPLSSPPDPSYVPPLPVLLVHSSLVEACSQAHGARSRGSNGGGGPGGDGCGGLASLLQLLPMHFQLRESASIASDMVRPAFPSFKLFIVREEQLGLRYKRDEAVKRMKSLAAAGERELWLLSVRPHVDAGSGEHQPDECMAALMLEEHGLDTSIRLLCLSSWSECARALRDLHAQKNRATREKLREARELLHPPADAWWLTEQLNDLGLGLNEGERNSLVDGFGSLAAIASASVAQLVDRTLLSDEQAEALHDIMTATGTGSSGASRNNNNEPQPQPPLSYEQHHEASRMMLDSPQTFDHLHAFDK